MPWRKSIGCAAFALAMLWPVAGAMAQDMSKYPDWEGQWRRGQGVGTWDPTKPPGKGQQAPLTPQAQAVFEANIKKIAEGKVYDPKWNCGDCLGQRGRGGVDPHALLKGRD